MGLVAFAGSAAVLVPPSTDRGALHEGIDRLAEGITGVQGTAIGEAISASLGAVKSLDEQAAKQPPPARIILLSDGANTSGADPMEAAAAAVAAKVPVHTISFGTPGGFVDRGGRPIQVPVDGQTLRAVADETGGGFHEAGSQRRAARRLRGHRLARSATAPNGRTSRPGSSGSDWCSPWVPPPDRCGGSPACPEPATGR